MMHEGEYIDARHSLPVAWDKDSARALISQHMGWFIVDVTKWKELPTYEPRAFITQIPPSFTYIKHAYEIVTDTINDAVEAIASIVQSTPKTEMEIEVKVRTREALLDEDMMMRLYLRVPRWGEEI